MRGRGSKRSGGAILASIGIGRPPCGGVDRNSRIAPNCSAIARSPSMRGRGSKRRIRRLLAPGGLVALHAGAWIETPDRSRCRSRLPVALHAGAWIETSSASSRSMLSMTVALHAGAWIETLAQAQDSPHAPGRPPCGGVDRNSDQVTASVRHVCRPPCGGVDRNAVANAQVVRQPEVALHAGAWIETMQCADMLTAAAVALHAGAWIETTSARFSAPCRMVALHAGAWIETSRCPTPPTRRLWSPSMRGRGSKHATLQRVTRRQWSPSMRGRGSKLPASAHRVGLRAVALHAGAWIETNYAPGWCGPNGRSPSMRGRGSKHLDRLDSRTNRRGRPPCGGVDRNAPLGAQPLGAAGSPSMRGRGSKLAGPAAV